MKALILSVFLLIFFLRFSFAQTNALPTSGNIGIGTTSPISTLQVSGSVLMSNPSGNNYNENLRLPPSSYDDYSCIALGAVSGTAGSGTGQWNIIRYPAANNNMFAIRYNGTDYLNILNNGNMGIGTTAPASILQLGNNSGSGVNTSTPTVLTMDHTYGTNALGTNFKLKLYSDGSGNSYGFGVSGSLLEIAAGPTGGISFFTNATTQAMNILSNGTVGINTTYISPGYQFAINGSALATSVTVLNRTIWPDYVFKKDYQLPSLTEVKTYIDQNQHLPEMPSAEQINKDGINLGEMNKLLVKKVEELTLYIIDQKQNAQTQQQEIDELKKQVTALLQLSNKNQSQNHN